MTPHYLLYEVTLMCFLVLYRYRYLHSGRYSGVVLTGGAKTFSALVLVLTIDQVLIYGVDTVGA
jgi:hypothetical protein